VYREEWDAINCFEAASGEDDRRHHTTHEHGNCIDINARPSSASQGAVMVWKSAFLSLFGDVWAIGRRWLHPLDQTVSIINITLSCTCMCEWTIVLVFDWLMIR
jgi:hypothetical protein